MGWGSVEDDSGAVSCPVPCDMSFEDIGTARGCPLEALIVTCRKQIHPYLLKHKGRSDLSTFRLLCLEQPFRLFAENKEVLPGHDVSHPGQR